MKQRSLGRFFFFWYWLLFDQTTIVGVTCLIIMTVPDTTRTIIRKFRVFGGALAGLGVTYPLLQLAQRWQQPIHIEVVDHKAVGTGGASAVAGGYVFGFVCWLVRSGWSALLDPIDPPKFLVKDYDKIIFATLDSAFTADEDISITKISETMKHNGWNELVHRSVLGSSLSHTSHPSCLR
jgi:hypothetical protein